MIENIDLPPSYYDVIRKTNNREELSYNESIHRLKPDILETNSSTQLLASYDSESSINYLYRNSIKTDYKNLRLALKRRSKNLLMNIFCNRSKKHLNELYKYYNEKHKFHLEYDIKDTFGRISPFTMIMMGLVQPLHEYIWQEFYIK